MNRLCNTSGIKAVLLPRNKDQESQIRAQWPLGFEAGRLVVPARAVDGLNLLWHSDLVVSGGGTMNREAAALGVPVYSIFRGKIGAVDRQLQAEGRLTLIETVEEVQHKIRLQPRLKEEKSDSRPRKALHAILGHVEKILELEHPKPLTVQI
jgi:predicted glycosyltransferase